MATYVIVGGVAGGATAAARLRRRDEHAEIIILERGEYVSFANCGLPYYIGGVIPERGSLLVSTAQKLADEFNIDVRTRHEVLAIDRGSGTVSVRELETGRVYEQPYDRLILSTGARPIVPPIAGVDLPGVYQLRSIPDTDRIKRAVDEGGVREATVVGGGFIGLEMAENLARRGVQVTLVEMMPQVMAPLDFEMAALVHRHLREQGVRLALGECLSGIAQEEDGRLRVELASGRRVPADMVLLALGVRPESELAREAGLQLGPRGHVVVNPQMQTSDPRVYAVGDMVQVLNPLTGAPYAVPLAGPANRQARIAADHITGREVAYQGTLGTAIVKAFELTAATAGANSRGLTERGIPFLSSITHSHDHVSYYPGATQQAIKLLYRPDDGRLLGAQVVGYSAVDRTIDTLAVALKAGMTVYDLEHLELAYSPQYGAAKDPVNVAGYVAANHLRGDTELVAWDELDPARHALLDVRAEAEWQAGHIEGAVHLPHTALRKRLGELSRDKEWIAYCAVGRRAYVAERILRQNGYRVANLSGGYATYAAATELQGNLPEGGDACGSDPAGDCCAIDMEPALAVPVLATAAPVPAEADGVARAMARLDARGLQCPGPIVAVYREMQALTPGSMLEVVATDPGFARDIRAWCERTGNALVDLERENGHIVAHLRKGAPQPEATLRVADHPAAKTMVVFSGDLDRALASFVIANGAAAMGQQVTMFFTFWGLNVLRKAEAARLPKNLVERMFGWMLPRGADRLALSKLHMGGMGTWMMKRVMRSKRIDSLPAMIETARQNGVRMIACQMSMDMMGIRQEELLDGVEVGGVATYINETDKASATLFI